MPHVTTLEASYARAKELARAFGTSYYAATYALPKVKRHHAQALYGFCRHAADVVERGAAHVGDRARAGHQRPR